MVNLNNKPPKEFIKKISKVGEIDFFVETGTYQGDTSTWASNYFQKVFTIEAFEQLFKATSEKFRNKINIEFIFGNCRQKLSEIINILDAPAIFWLDAHYSGNGTYGEKDKCPLLDEIIIINSSKFENIILIDDARAFLSPPTISHNLDDWPDITTIINLLQKIQDRYIIILEDVIFVVPNKYKNLTAVYAQKINSINNLADSFGT